MLTITWKGRPASTCRAIPAVLEWGVKADMQAVAMTWAVIQTKSCLLVGPSLGIKGPMTQPYQGELRL